MKHLNIPVTYVGANSQPPEKDGGTLDYLDLPEEINTYAPQLPEPEDIASAPQALATLYQLLELLELLEQPRTDTTAQFVDVSNLGAEQIKLLDQVLGEGEVSIRLHDNEEWQIQESVFTGMWRVRRPATGLDRIEIGNIPAVVREYVLSNTAPRLVIPNTSNPPGVINAHALLIELADNQAIYHSGVESHVINLTLLPHTPEDIDYLRTCLGQGRTLILSRGYGNCRITATGVSNIWWVQYFNATDAMILNTLEVVDIPVVALAAREDLEDTTIRLREMLETIQ